MIVVQRDYVRRSQPTSLRHRKSSAKKKQSNLPSVSPIMVAIAVAVLMTLFSTLYFFITHYGEKKAKAFEENRVIGSNALPQKPEERWHYIKELESRQSSRYTPTELSAGDEVENANQLLSNEESNKSVTQIQADILHQQITQPSEVRWNKQKSTQRQGQKQVQQQWIQAQPVQQPKIQLYEQPQQQTRMVESQALQQQLKTQQITKTIKKTDKQMQMREKEDERRWIIQCGSFKDTEQAETVRAQLAFEGFDSNISTNNDWNRVVIGPVKGKNNADGTIARLKVAGHTKCIRLASGVENPKTSPIYHSIRP